MSLIIEDFMRKHQIKKLIFLICFWIACTIFITFYDAAVLDFKSEIEGEYYSFIRVFISAVLVTIVGASLLGSLEVFVLANLLRKKPFGISLLFKTFIYLSFILFFTSIVVMYNYSAELDKSLFHPDSLQLYTDYFTKPRVLMAICYWSIACFLALFILQVNDKYGQGILFDFLIGKYHRPKEENCIFLFMDLKDSTTHAEKLGHIKYSRFIQDCFYDITDVVIKHKAKIYQYVGDEAVLSWKISDGLDNGNCINIFYAYDAKLKSREDYYKNEYGIIPEFKAGVNSGRVTVAEVGEIKKELAYHGDVLNTAARIQGKCNEFRKKILVSEQIKMHFDNQSAYNFEFLGEVMLKGKAQAVNIYGVNVA